MSGNSPGAASSIREPILIRRAAPGVWL